MELYYFGVLIIMIAAFEFLTSNTVINIVYSNTLTPWQAALYFGVFNLLGIVAAGITVAVSVSLLLPTEAFLKNDLFGNFLMVAILAFTSLLVYGSFTQFGIPCSSTHSLTGALIGVGLGHSYIHHTLAEIDFELIIRTLLGLLLTPFLAFLIGILLWFIVQKLSNTLSIFDKPNKEKRPPFSVQAMNLCANAVLSFTNGSNNGQKGIGVCILALIAIYPSDFALDTRTSKTELLIEVNNIESIILKIDIEETAKHKISTYHKAVANLENIKSALMNGNSSFNQEALYLRNEFQQLIRRVNRMEKNGTFDFRYEDRVALRNSLYKSITIVKDTLYFVPFALIVFVAIVLTLGALYSYRRILNTWKNKIGKATPDYSQLAVSDMAAAISIGISSFFSLPASTSQLLTGGLAGSMVAQKGVSGVKWNFFSSLFAAWLFTMPASALIAFILSVVAF